MPITTIEPKIGIKRQLNVGNKDKNSHDDHQTCAPRVVALTDAVPEATERVVP